MERALEAEKLNAKSIQNLMQLAHKKLVSQGLFNGGSGADYGYFSRSNPGFTILANNVWEGRPSIAAPAPAPKPEAKPTTKPITATAAKTNTTTYLIAGLVVVLVVIGIFIFKTSKKK
jgi:hypothetical protein